MYSSRSQARSDRRIAGCDHPDDAELVAAAKADPREFSALYERYVERVYRYCYRRLGSKEAAEDATSDVFLKALTAIDRYHEGVFAAWLFRIAHNVVVDAYRRGRPSAPIEAVSDTVDPSRTPESMAIAQAECDWLQRALARLPHDERAVVELPYAGWSGEEIAEALGRTPNAVKSLRYRAIRRLRALLTDRHAGAPREAGDA